MTDSRGNRVGPHPSFIKVAQPYIFEDDIQKSMSATGVSPSKEDSIRLLGVAWIDNVRRALQLPVKTFTTAVVYYHKFRLAHSDNEYNYVDAAAAALFTACKIEDTLKKSKEILCAADNLKYPPAEHLTPDDPKFEAHSKAIIGLERLMLEASGFDFRSRQPQKHVIKLAKLHNVEKDSVGKKAWNVSLDLYRTFAPLKQTTYTMAMASLELAIRLCDKDTEGAESDLVVNPGKWCSTREEVMETLLDLLDLYNNHRGSTIVGQEHPLDSFINIRIALNNEVSSKHYPRYMRRHERSSNGTTLNNNTLPANKDSYFNRAQTSPSSTNSPSTPLDNRARVGERDREGTVRFMLDASHARSERSTVDTFFKYDEEEYEVVDELPSSN